MTARRLGLSMATAPAASRFAPLVFAGRMEAALQALSEAGFDGIEISLRCAEEIDADWLARQLSRYRLVVSAFASGRMCLEDALCMCNPQPEIRARAVDELKSLIRLAASFQAPLIIGGVRGRLTGSDEQQAIQRAGAVGGLRVLAHEALQSGTHLLIEPINRYETNFINNAREGMQLIDEIGSPAVQLLLDTFHMNIEEADPAATIREAGACLGYFHCADSNRLAPGRGHVDFASLLASLNQIGYSGFLSAEILPLPTDEAALAQTYQHLALLRANGLIDSD